MRAGLRDFPGRRQFTDVAVEGDPPEDDRPPVRTSGAPAETAGSRLPRVPEDEEMAEPAPPPPQP
eukprot:1791603-Alexandrium_andersonii.AAC.1